MFKKVGFVALAAIMLGINGTCALADTIDEQYKDFMSQYNAAKNSGQITAKQASELDHDLREFSKTKRSLRDKHADVTTADDEVKLNAMLSNVAQKLETMTANKGAAPEKTSAPQKTKAPKKK
ncbi:MAG TPA: hypothetical protein V6C89_10265 [Drouetiella sp.]|jgi:uncharacterized protein (UPF0276 family)